MENDEWNFDEWQGRSEKQVTTNNKVFGYVIFTAILLVMFQSVFNWASVPMDYIDLSFSNLSV